MHTINPIKKLRFQQRRIKIAIQLCKHCIETTAEFPELLKDETFLCNSLQAVVNTATKKPSLTKVKKLYDPKPTNRPTIF